MVNVQGNGQGQWSPYLTSDEIVVKEVEHFPFEIYWYAKPSMGTGKDVLIGKALIPQQALKEMYLMANESVDIKGQLMTASPASSGGGSGGGGSGGVAGGGVGASTGVAAGKFVLNMKFVTPDREGEIHTVGAMMDDEASSKKPEVTYLPSYLT